MSNETQPNNNSNNPFAVGDVKAVIKITEDVINDPHYWSKQADKIKCYLDSRNLFSNSTSKE